MEWASWRESEACRRLTTVLEWTRRIAVFRLRPSARPPRLRAQDPAESSRLRPMRPGLRQTRPKPFAEARLLNLSSALYSELRQQCCPKTDAPQKASPILAPASNRDADIQRRTRLAWMAMQGIL